MMIPANARLNLYKRLDIQKEIIREALGKEVGVKYGDKGYGKRPDVLRNEADVLEFAKEGVTSFHVSEETWKDPLQIETGMSKKKQDELRVGWDIVLDIDCAFIEYSKIACDLLVRVLKHHGVRSISVKFSGNKGFHIGIPFEAFPTKIGGEDVSNLFPEVPRRVAAYLTDKIKNPLSEEIEKFEGGNFENVMKKVGLSAEEITRFEKDELGSPVAKLNVEPFLEVDTILISSRHLYRGAYSFNEKSGLVSIPIDPSTVMDFTKDMARPENVKVGIKFMDRENASEGECIRLFREAYDHKPVVVEETGMDRKVEYDELTEAVPEELFPPCVKVILDGKLKDGKKRSMFVLLNFLASAGWNHDQIEERMKQWNKDLEEPIREVILGGQLRYRKDKKEKILPPNCDNRGYYIDIGICKPDGLCKRIRNPVNYSRRKVFAVKQSSTSSDPARKGKDTASRKATTATTDKAKPL